MVKPFEKELLIEGQPLWKLALKAAWIAVRIYCVLLIGEKGVLFFYQAF